jgi:hypothetical protein
MTACSHACVRQLRDQSICLFFDVPQISRHWHNRWQHSYWLNQFGSASCDPPEGEKIARMNISGRLRTSLQSQQMKLNTHQMCSANQRQIRCRRPAQGMQRSKNVPLVRHWRGVLRRQRRLPVPARPRPPRPVSTPGLRQLQQRVRPVRSSTN